MNTASKTLSIRLAATGGDNLRREFDKLGTRGQRAFDKISDATRPASGGIKAVNFAARTLNNVFRQAAMLAGAYVGIRGITRSLGFIVSTNREFERLHASLKTVTGSLQGADDAFAMIEHFASSTPFNVEQITEAFIQLKAMGLEPSADALRSYGNTAAAMSKDLMSFVGAVTDAATGRFQRLKQFGIKAITEGEQVAITFQGATTMVGKNAKEIESYLRKIGKVQFAGAMKVQMDTLNGIFSNIQDNLSHLAREVGQGGLTKAIHDVALGLKKTTDSGEKAAQALGKSLGTVVRVSANSLGFLFQHAGLAAKGLGTLVIARTVSKAIKTLSMAIMGKAGAIAGIRLMASLSAGAAAKMVVLQGAAQLTKVAMLGLRGAMMLLGGPAGIAVTASMVLYKLAKRHDAAAKAAKDHAAELNELHEQLAKTVGKASDLQSVSYEENIARLNKALKTAQNNIKAVTREITFAPMGNLWDKIKRLPHIELTKDLHQIREAFRSGKISIDEYQKSIWALANKYPNLYKQANALKQQVEALEAAKRARDHALTKVKQLQDPSAKAKNVNDADGSIKNVVAKLDRKQIEHIKDIIAGFDAEKTSLQRLVAARSKGNEAVQRALVLNEKEHILGQLGINLQQAQSKEALDYADRIGSLVKQKHALQQADKNNIETVRQHSRAVEEISHHLREMHSSAQQAVEQANDWRKNTLDNLDKTKEGYDDFAKQVEDIYQNKLAQAREVDLANSRRWSDGLKRGFNDVFDGASDAATQAENATVRAFLRMEDAMAEFVIKGKLDFKSLANSIIADIVRIQVRQHISAPISGALSNMNFGSLFGAAHTGGVIGGDRLSQRVVHPAVFNNAPKFHGGGIVGNEVPIIAKRGETVFTKGQMQLLGMQLHHRQKPTNVTVHVHNNAQGVRAKTHTSKNDNGDVKLDIMIEKVEQQLAHHMNRGEGLAPVLEKRYGLNPAMGSYR